MTRFWPRRHSTCSGRRADGAGDEWWWWWQWLLTKSWRVRPWLTSSSRCAAAAAVVVMIPLRRQQLRCYCWCYCYCSGGYRCLWKKLASSMAMCPHSWTGSLSPTATPTLAPLQHAPQSPPHPQQKQPMTTTPVPPLSANHNTHRKTRLNFTFLSIYSNGYLVIILK